MPIELRSCDKNFNNIFKEGDSFKVIRCNNSNPNHTIVLQDSNNPDSYFLINTPIGIIGELYSLIIISNESKYSKNRYLNISDISSILSEFKSKYPNADLELNIGLHLSEFIKTDNDNYYGKTYKESDYIYQFPGDICMCMVTNDCEPDKIYIMVGGLDKDDN